VRRGWTRACAVSVRRRACGAPPAGQEVAAWWCGHVLAPSKPHVP
jgi:hypothetical protein